MSVTLRRLPSFWGVASLVALLIALPWLPLGYKGDFVRETPLVREPGAQSVVTSGPSSSRDDSFTIYVVNDRDEADKLSKQVDPQRAVVALVLTPQDDDRLARYILDTNQARTAAQIRDLSVVDLRK